MNWNYFTGAQITSSRIDWDSAYSILSNTLFWGTPLFIIQREDYPPNNGNKSICLTRWVCEYSSTKIHEHSSGDVQHFARDSHNSWVYDIAKTILPLSVAINIHVMSPQNNFEVHDSLHYRILHYSTGIFVKSTLSSSLVYFYALELCLLFLWRYIYTKL